MTPEIEKVARAIWEARRQHAQKVHGYELDAWGDGSIPNQNGIMHEARAAIEAMREPTQRMRAAAARKGWNPEGGQDIEECWPAMIDAALGEPPK